MNSKFLFNTSLNKSEENFENQEIIKNILKTKIELDIVRQNYEFAESGLIDYFLYQIKANQSKLDFLIKKAKSQNIKLSTIEEIKYYHYNN